MPTSRAYLAKRQHYMGLARKAKCQLVTMPPKYKPSLRLLVNRYVGHARIMNHKALELQRLEDQAEFRVRVRQA